MWRTLLKLSTELTDLGREVARYDEEKLSNSAGKEGLRLRRVDAGIEKVSKELEEGKGWCEDDDSDAVYWRARLGEQLRKVQREWLRKSETVREWEEVSDGLSITLYFYFNYIYQLTLT